MAMCLFRLPLKTKPGKPLPHILMGGAGQIPRTRSCGKNAVRSYKIRTKWQSKIMSLCPSHVPTDGANIIVYLEKHCFEYSRDILTVEEVDTATTKDQKIQIRRDEFIGRLMTILNQKNLAKFSDEELTACFAEAMKLAKVKRILE